MRFVFLIIGTVFASASAVCPNGWLRHGHSCYLINPHLYETWEQALLVCMLKNGGYLAEVNDHFEDNFLLQETRAFGGDWWIGGDDFDIEGEWYWSHSHKLIHSGYRNWYPGEPNSMSTSENCLEYNYEEGAWNDENCAKRQRFICEKPLGSSGHIIG